MERKWIRARSGGKEGKNEERREGKWDFRLLFDIDIDKNIGTGMKSTRGKKECVHASHVFLRMYIILLYTADR